MNRVTKLDHEFVEYTPDVLEDGTLYVSLTYGTVVHKCCCGCGSEVVTPLSPTDWKLIFDGESVSLEPSIGSWDLACKSHYWIEHSRVRWATQWSQGQIAAGRAHGRLAKDRYYDKIHRHPRHSTSLSSDLERNESRSRENFWRRLKKWWKT